MTVTRLILIGLQLVNAWERLLNDDVPDLTLNRDSSSLNLTNLFELTKNASSSMMKIKGDFKSITSIGNSMGPENTREDWADKFRVMDHHLSMIKQKANAWDVEVYPVMKAAFDNIDSFGSKFTRSYKRFEPSLNNEEPNIENAVNHLRDKLEYQGVSRRDIQFKLNNLRDEHEAKVRDGPNYRQGLQEVESLCNHAVRYAQQFEEKSQEASLLIGQFEKGLNVEKNNFIQDHATVNNFTNEIQTNFIQEIASFLEEVPQYNDSKIDNKMEMEILNLLENISNIAQESSRTRKNKINRYQITTAEANKKIKQYITMPRNDFAQAKERQMNYFTLLTEKRTKANSIMDVKRTEKRRETAVQTIKDIHKEMDSAIMLGADVQNTWVRIVLELQKTCDAAEQGQQLDNQEMEVEFTRLANKLKTTNDFWTLFATEQEKNITLGIY